MKTLTMQFLNESQKAVSLSIESPKDTLDAAAITAAMNALIASDVFTSSGGALVARKGAQIVERNVIEFTI
ncbi:DUF2922 domain-containing protein [Priestia sp. TSO9]|uniref:DUF2922 domain-containing protein n=1 Tax=Priestia TaxID=2800373 RepID=UPI001E615751|nr:DUF2922 domain-containing protein [Priestia sp. TSO9]